MNARRRAGLQLKPRKHEARASLERDLRSGSKVTFKVPESRVPTRVIPRLNAALLIPVYRRLGEASTGHSSQLLESTPLGMRKDRVSIDFVAHLRPTLCPQKLRLESPECLATSIRTYRPRGGRVSSSFGEGPFCRVHVPPAARESTAKSLSLQEGTRASREPSVMIRGWSRRQSRQPKIQL